MRLLALPLSLSPSRSLTLSPIITPAALFALPCAQAVKVLKSAMLSATQSIAAVEMLMQEAQGLARASDNGVNAHVVQVRSNCQSRRPPARPLRALP